MLTSWAHHSMCFNNVPIANLHSDAALLYRGQLRLTLKVNICKYNIN